MIMISCPSTGRAVSTEIEMQNVERLPTVIATIVCPACGGVHQWTKNDAWLEKGGEHAGRSPQFGAARSFALGTRFALRAYSGCENKAREARAVRR
jgi:hypothetical protein